MIICCLLADHVSLGSILPTAAASEEHTSFSLFFQITFYWDSSCSIARASPRASNPGNSSHQRGLMDAEHPVSLTFQTAALPFLVNASCPFPRVPDQTKTQVSTPSQSCAPGLADLCTTQQAQTRPLRDNLGKNKQQLTSKQLCYTWCCNFCCNDKCSKLTDVRHLKITLAFKYNGIFKVRLLECFSFNCLSHQGALRSHFHAFIGK